MSHVSAALHWGWAVKRPPPWLVLRFAWEDVMFDSAHVHDVLVAVVHERGKRSIRCTCAA